MFNTYGVKVLPRGILKQIYFKESKSTILKSKKDSIMYLRSNKLNEIYHDLNFTEKNLKAVGKSVSEVAKDTSDIIDKVV